MANVLIIDDDAIFSEMLAMTVSRMSHTVDTAMTLEDGLRKATSEYIDVVFLDVRMPDGNGLDYLPQFAETPSQPEVIIITGLGDPDGAEMAIRSGAWAYVQKGSSIKEITLPLARALQYRQEKTTRPAPVSLKRNGIIGNSPRLRSALDLMAQAANSHSNVLITGETGTGKEVFARAIHENSSRSENNFVVVDCAALPATLVESVLFGHERGSFTGADRAQEGLVAQANKGTLFLDEVGELPMAMQKAFLRVLQEHHFRPVGGNKMIKSDFRLVAATNRTLDDMVSKGQFRSDLLYRLRTFVIELPGLREFKEDIKELAMYHMVELCERNMTGTKGFSSEFLNALMAYDWPGNVRELVHTLDRAIASAQDEPTLYSKHLPPHIRIQLARSAVMEDSGASRQPETTPIPDRRLPKLAEYRENMERQYFKELVAISEGDMKRACDISGLSRSRLYDLLKKYEIGKPG